MSVSPLPTVVTWWLCRGCDKRFGFVRNGRVIVRANRHEMFDLAPGSRRNCPRCGEWNVFEPDEAGRA